MKSTESPISEEFIQNLMNSEYTENLKPLKSHVKAKKVINTIVGNNGFILKLDNNSWASAYRADDSILSEFGEGDIPEISKNKINSTKSGNATRITINDIPYSNELNDLKTELKKSHGKLLEGLAIGSKTFNFAFENGMELDFQLCNDENGKQAIRVFWEQW